jgi:hypothetical protein
MALSLANDDRYARNACNLVFRTRNLAPDEQQLLLFQYNHRSCVVNQSPVHVRANDGPHLLNQQNLMTTISNADKVHSTKTSFIKRNFLQPIHSI